MNLKSIYTAITGGVKIKSYVFIPAFCLHVIRGITGISLCSAFFVSTGLYCQTNPEVYFNSGIDRYVKGDYDGAIALFEQTLTEKPDHQKAKNFLLKVLIEATEKQIMVSNFRKAKSYIDKAKTISPDDVKINELQKVISGGYKKTPEDFSKKEISPAAPSAVRPAAKKEEPKKRVAAVPVAETEKGETFVPEIRDSGKIAPALVFSVLFAVVVFIFIWIKISAGNNAKKLERIRKQIKTEEEKKYRDELEKIKKLEGEKIKKEFAENLKIRRLEKKTISEKDMEKARADFETTVDEEKLTDAIAANIKNDQYSKQIIQKMVISIRTIMNVNKGAALENIERLSKSGNSRLRYDCTKIIEDILTDETFKILLDLLADGDYEVKRSAIIAVNNIVKLRSNEISCESLAAAKSRLIEEKIKNGWII